jgi:NADP-dependent 3-hydroxy acid dehydrogenase YdfG
MPIRINVAIGGSTNAVIHLLAVAGRIGVPLSLDDWDRLGREVPTIVDLMPSGRFGILSIRAGYVHQGDIFACTAQDWERSFDISVTSMYRTWRAFLPAMVTQRNLRQLGEQVRRSPGR